MVDDVMSGKLEIKRGGSSRMATMLFADIRGLPRCRARPAQEIVKLLNEYFEIMVELVFANGGTLDKFMARDHAVWGAPIAMDDHCERAVRAALQMQRSLTQLNLARTNDGLEAIHMGIGVNGGELVAGFMGLARHGLHRHRRHREHGLALLQRRGPGEVVGESVRSQLGARLIYNTMEPTSSRGRWTLWRSSGSAS